VRMESGMADHHFSKRYSMTGDSYPNLMNMVIGVISVDTHSLAASAMSRAIVSATYAKPSNRRADIHDLKLRVPIAPASNNPQSTPAAPPSRVSSR